FSSSAPLPHLPAVPTRRSSDLRLFSFLIPTAALSLQIQVSGLPGPDIHLNRTFRQILFIDRQNIFCTDVNPFLCLGDRQLLPGQDRESTRLNSSHVSISYAVFC